MKESKIIMNLINTEIQSIEDKIIELQNEGEDVTTLINNLTNFKIALENINYIVYLVLLLLMKVH